MMRWILVLIAAMAFGQSGMRMQVSNTDENLRGVSVVSREVAWASGAHGTYLRTIDGGRTWSAAQVPDAAGLDFRGIAAFSAEEAFLMSAGPGEQSRIYHTADAGKHWQLQFEEKNPKGFLDSMVFWDAKHGVALGDPVVDDAGKLKFEVLRTDDGQNWRAIPTEKMPEAKEGEGAFAASNSCVAIVPGAGDENIWFATGGKVARVFHSADRGKTWMVVDTPITHGPESAGIFSISFRDARRGVIAGGDYKRPELDGPNLAFTEDGGKTWALAEGHRLAFFSAVGYEPGASKRIFVVGQNSVFEIRPSGEMGELGRISGRAFNAGSAFPGGGVLVVGAKGLVAEAR